MRRYETKISTARWIVCDIPGNIGWILYLVCLVTAFVRDGGHLALLLAGVVPAACMLVAIGELVSQRIAKIDRVLPLSRLLRSFGALTLGGALGAVVALVGGILYGGALYWFMLGGGALCFACSLTLLVGYRKKEEETGSDR